MTQSQPWYRGRAFGLTIAVVATAIGLYSYSNKRSNRNSVANLELNQIGAVWFLPSGKTDDDLVWLDNDQIQPLFNLFSSSELDQSPAKWTYVGRVGFTYPNGRVASVKLYDTNSDQGAFSCGRAYFRYDGRIPDSIRNAK